MNNPLNPLSPDLVKKVERLKTILGAYKKAALAFSGGGDSAFLLAAAAEAGMESLLAVTIVSQFFTREEIQRSKAIADGLGVEHLCIDLDILSDEQVRWNDARRCYHCKRNGFTALKSAAAERGIKVLIHGINQDDLREDRPGIKAAEELGFRAPLVEAKLSKDEIRQASKAMGLSTWDLPSQSCLATRIPRGETITAQGLQKVEQAEALLHELGFAQVRVRCHGALARIELPEPEISRAASPEFRNRISDGLRPLGFAFVSLDLAGYGRGNMTSAADKP